MIPKGSVGGGKQKHILLPTEEVSTNYCPLTEIQRLKD